MYFTNSLEVEVTNISLHRFWLLLNWKEHFLQLADFPWFQKAVAEKIMIFWLIHKTHYYWPLLDIELYFNCIENPRASDIKFFSKPLKLFATLYSIFPLLTTFKLSSCDSYYILPPNLVSPDIILSLLLRL